MNIPGNNCELLSSQTIMYLRNRFNQMSKLTKHHNKHINKISYISTITIKQLCDIIIEEGYLPSREEINDITSELEFQVLDFIYFLVIIGRIYDKIKLKQNKKELENAFDLIDVNRKNIIQVKKLLIKIPNCEGLNQEEINDILFMLDKKIDDMITKEEFLELIK